MKNLIKLFWVLIQWLLQSMYIYYKLTFSIIVLLNLVNKVIYKNIVISQLNCIDIDTYYFNSDKRTFTASSLKKKIEQNKLNISDKTVMLNDKTFPLSGLGSYEMIGMKQSVSKKYREYLDI